MNEYVYRINPGPAYLEDLNRKLKLAVPESEGYTTIGGFLMTAAGHVLKPGEVIRYNSLVFQIERVERRRVMRVRLELPEKEEEPKREAAADGVAASR